MIDRRSKRGPDFLIIGAQRAGTTWLHDVLKQHPALWLTPVKELHYFDKPSRTRTWLDPYERRRVWPRSFDLWHLKYLLGRRGDDWYADLFHKAQIAGRLAGESTPSYAVLQVETLRQLRDINPQVKMILVMRDPVDRAWSSITNAQRKGRFDEITVEEAVKFACSKKIRARSMYLETIDRVQSVFGPDQLYCGFFDDLRDRPQQFLAEVLAFLGVEPDPDWSPVLPSGVNATSRNAPMPKEFARKMAEVYLPAVKELGQHFEGPPQKWYARYHALLDAAHAEND